MNSKVLIAYYSHSGNTEKIAKMIQEEKKGTLLQITPREPYPQEYKEVAKQAVREIKSGFVPEIAHAEIDLAQYDTILVGTPNWCGTIAPPVTAFLKEQDFTGKKVSVFCTHGGSGLAYIPGDVEKLCPGAKMLPAFEVSRERFAEAPEAIAAWLKKADLAK